MGVAFSFLPNPTRNGEAEGDQVLTISVDRIVSSLNGGLARAAGGRDGVLPTIYRVPPNVRGNDATGAFDPQFVSIGPFHWKKKGLEHTQQLKWRYLQDLLDRSPSRNTINKYVEAVSRQEQRAREEYYFLDEEMNSGEFVEMLVLDGCFLVEFFLKRAQQRLPRPFHVKWYLPLLRRDLCLLENQIPFFILQTIFSISDLPLPTGAAACRCPESLLEYTMHYIAKEKAAEMVECINNLREAPYHLLHLFYLYELNGFDTSAADNERSSTDRPPAPRAIPCATKLSKAGVKLQMVERDCRLNVSFTAGVLEIPFLAIQQDTVTKFLNLVAFEQCRATGGGRPFTSYCIFLDNIIDTAEDVVLLEKHKIIESKLGSSKDVARLINGICRGAATNYDGHYLAGLFRQVNQYHDSKINKWIAELRYGTCRNPLVATAFVASFILLLISAGQFVLAVLRLHSGKG